MYAEIKTIAQQIQQIEFIIKIEFIYKDTGKPIQKKKKMMMKKKNIFVISVYKR